MDNKKLLEIFSKQLLANHEVLCEIQTRHFMAYQDAAYKYCKEHPDDNPEERTKKISEMQVRALADSSLETFKLGIQVGINAVMDFGETILNNGIKNIN